MKNFRVTSFAAISAAVFALSSCMSNSLPSIDIVTGNASSNEDEISVKLGSITQATTYKYSIKASTTVELYIDDARVAIASSFDKGEKKMNSEVTIKAIATSSEYSSEPVIKKVKLDTNGKVIYIDIPKRATNSAAVTALQAKATASSNGSVKITNSASNQSLAYNAKTTANLTLTNSAISSISDDKNIAIDIENASTANVVQGLDVTEEFFNVMVVKASSKGTSLSESANITINNSNFEKGMIFKCSSETREKEVSNKDYFDFSINELNDYTISCQARVEFIDSVADTKTEGFFAVPVGNRDITYYTKSGYTCDYESNEFITKYLNAKFGVYTEKGKQVVTIANNDNKANVPYEINQTIYNYKVHFGTITVNVKVYGPDHLEVFANKAEKYTTSK